MHVGEHDVGAEARTGDEGAAGADQHGGGRIEPAHHGGNVRCQQVHHASGGGLHDIGYHQQAAHGHQHRHHVTHGLGADLAVLLPSGFQRHRAKEAADQDHHVHPHDVAEGAHDGEAVFHQCGEAVADGGQQHQHVDVGGHGAERAVLLLLTGEAVTVFLRRFHAHHLHIDHAEEDGEKAGAHGGDFCAHEVGEDEHHCAGGHTGKAEVGDDALEALAAEGHGHHDKGDHQHAEHMDAAHHGGVQRHGAEAGVGEGRAAVDGGQASAAPGAGRGVAQQGQRDGGHRVKAQRHQKRGGDGGGRACACRALQKDGEHHADDDHLHPAVVTDAGDGALHLVDGAGITEQVQDHEGAEHHQHDLQTLLDALPEKGVIDGYVVLEGSAGDIEIRKGQQKRPQQSHGSDALGGLAEAQNAHQHHDDGAECHDEIEEAHRNFSHFLLMLGWRRFAGQEKRTEIYEKKRLRRMAEPLAAVAVVVLTRAGRGKGTSCSGM